MSNIPTLTIIGAGKLGRSLGRLWQDAAVLSIRSICNSSLKSAKAAVEFIGDGSACNEYSNISQSDIILIATPDSSIRKSCELLVSQHNWLKRSTVFHCSGSLDSRELSSASDIGANIASIHPIKSFADPIKSIQNFTGTYCGSEGDSEALEILIPVFEKIDAHCFPIAAGQKQHYHAAAVLANNYFVTLIDAAQKLYEHAGVSRDQSMMLLTPMLEETIQNLASMGTRKSLTGPIARGDLGTVKKHLSALESSEPDIANIYRLLGKLSLALTEMPTDKQKQFEKEFVDGSGKNDNLSL